MDHFELVPGKWEQPHPSLPTQNSLCMAREDLDTKQGIKLHHTSHYKLTIGPREVKMAMTWDRKEMRAVGMLPALPTLHPVLMDGLMGSPSPHFPTYICKS